MELMGEGFLEEVMIPKQSFKGSTYNNEHKKYHIWADSGIILYIFAFGLI